MQIIYAQKLTEFAKKHSTSRSGIGRWLSLMQQENFRSIHEVREVFPHADLVKKETPGRLRQQVPYTKRTATFTVFNIGGNKARLIAIMRYEAQQVIIQDVLTHAEYNAWSKKR